MKHVADILNTKGSEVWTITPHQNVFDALSLMAEKEIGALLVMQDDKLRGIFTERDYARKIILKGLSSKSCVVGDIMTSKVLCVTPEHSVDECLALMTDGRLRHLPVIDHKKVVGLISIGDLVKITIEDQQFIIEQMQSYISG